MACSCSAAAAQWQSQRLTRVGSQPSFPRIPLGKPRLDVLVPEPRLDLLRSGLITDGLPPFEVDVAGQAQVQRAADRIDDSRRNRCRKLPELAPQLVLGWQRRDVQQPGSVEPIQMRALLRGDMAVASRYHESPEVIESGQQTPAWIAR